MSLEYIRKTYGVPAYKGAKIRYTGVGNVCVGTITSSNCAHLLITFESGGELADGKEHILHPTWNIEYL